MVRYLPSSRCVSVWRAPTAPVTVVPSPCGRTVLVSTFALASRGPSSRQRAWLGDAPCDERRGGYWGEPRGRAVWYTAGDATYPSRRYPLEGGARRDKRRVRGYAAEDSHPEAPGGQSATPDSRGVFWDGQLHRITKPRAGPVPGQPRRLRCRVASLSLGCSGYRGRVRRDVRDDCPGRKGCGGGAEPLVPERRARWSSVLRRTRGCAGGRCSLSRFASGGAPVREAHERGCPEQRDGRRRGGGR